MILHTHWMQCVLLSPLTLTALTALTALCHGTVPNKLAAGLTLLCSNQGTIL